MAIVSQREQYRKWQADTGNEKKTNPIVGLRNDRTLVSIEKFFDEKEGKDRFRVALDADGNEFRATQGIIGNIEEIVLREVGDPYPNIYVQIKLVDSDGQRELIEIGSVFSTVARSVVSCLRSTTTPLYGAELKIKTYANHDKNSGKTYTNAIVELNGTRLKWAFAPAELNEQYPAKKLMMGDDGIPLENINGSARSVRDGFWDNQIKTLVSQINKEKEAAVPQPVAEDTPAKPQADVPTQKGDDDDLPF